MKVSAATSQTIPPKTKERTSIVLGIKNSNITKRITPLRNQLITLCVVPPFPSPGNQHSIVEHDEAHRVIDLVRGGVQREQAVHLEDDVSAWSCGYELAGAFDLRVKVLHLIRI